MSFDDSTAESVEQLRRRIADALDRHDEIRAALPDVIEQLGVYRSTASSPDGAVDVTVNAAGSVVDVRLAADAFRTGSPDSLSRSIADTAHRATWQALRHVADVSAVMADSADALAELPDPIPNASLRDLRESLWQLPKPRSDRAGA
ncbi:YbaB/EbfC family nucleoid-associated protein [Nocardia wallacei]|uniref:YbaB/EbfC family nucleoid-associated protein n=1 Tax=Nocardia wallacei TaxID=480035 RepID=UPI002457EB60|nr:YbaB/EbfC family nucleoid-associated protein [Nocardia wallacei]